MATFEVTSPDGKTFEITAPDGASEQEVLKYAQQNWEQPEAAAAPRKLDVATKNPMLERAYNYKGADAVGGWAGGAGSIGATLFAPFDYAQQGLESLMGAPKRDVSINNQRREDIEGGLQSLGVDTTSPQYQANKLLTQVGGSAGAGPALAGVLTNAAPRLAAQIPNLLSAIQSGGMTAGAKTGLGAAATRVAGGAVAGGATAGLVNPEDAKNGFMIGAATPLAVQLAGSAGKFVNDKVRNNLAERISDFNKKAPLNQTIRESLDAGYIIPPNLAKPGFVNRAIESVSGKQATQQIASVQNAKVTDDLVRKALDLAPDAPLTKEAMQAYRASQHSAGYEPVRNLGAIQGDKAFSQALDDLANKYTGKGTIPAIQRNDIRELVNSHKSPSFDSGDAVDAMRVLRESADEAFRKGDTAIAKTYKGISQAYEDVIERNLQKSGQTALLDGFKKSRANMAKSFTVEGAIVDGSGGINPQKLAAALQKGKPLSGELLTAAKFANTFKTVAKPLEQIGSPAAHNLNAWMTGGAGTLGAVVGGPAGAAIGAGTALAAPALARSIMFREGAQRGLLQAAPKASSAAQLSGLLADPKLQQLVLRTAPVIGNR